MWEIKLPEENELVKKLRREQTLPVCVPAKIRLLEKWPAEYDYEFRRETDGSIMADLLLRVFQAYGGEIRQKKIKELLETTIPEALHEVRLKSNSKYALSSSRAFSAEANRSRALPGAITTCISTAARPGSTIL